MAMSLLGSFHPAQGQTVNTCAQYYTVGTASSPSYNVETNYWNMGSCPGTQCMNINTSTGDFAVTEGPAACSDNVATYPAVYYGCHFGNCSSGTNLPMLVSSLQCVTSSWTISATNTGLWDAAYDIWFGTSTNTSSHSAELMIWLDYMPGTGPAGSLQATNAVIGNSPTHWNIYEGPVGGWNYIAFLATTNVTSFDDVDILAFIQYCETKNYILPTWYLHAIEAGNELRTGGVPFTSSGFSASVNTASCGTPTPAFTATPTATFTPTVTDTPCMIAGTPCTPTLTFTPTVTATPTATPSNLYTVYPNPWPDTQNPGDTLNFYYNNDQSADQVQLKIFTLAYRKIYEDDTLPAIQRSQVPWAVNMTNLNLSNGLYYFVIIWKNGGHQSQKVMKVLVRR